MKLAAGQGSQEPQEQDQEALEQQAAQAAQEQFLVEAKQVKALVHQEGFQVLQGRWQLLLQSYRDELGDSRKSVDELRVLQGKIQTFADIKYVLEEYLRVEKENA